MLRQSSARTDKPDAFRHNSVHPDALEGCLTCFSATCRSIFLRNSSLVTVCRFIQKPSTVTSCAALLPDIVLVRPHEKSPARDPDHVWERCLTSFRLWLFGRSHGHAIAHNFFLSVIFPTLAPFAPLREINSFSAFSRQACPFDRLRAGSEQGRRDAKLAKQKFSSPTLSTLLPID